MLIRILSSVMSIVMITACVSVPVATSPGKIRVEYTRSFSDGSVLKKTPTEVTIVKRASTAKVVASQVGLGVLTFLAAGSVGGFSFSKDDLKGDEIDDLSNRANIQNPVASQFVVDLQSKVDAAVQANAAWREKLFVRSLFVGGGSSRLVYDTLIGSDEERFRLKTDLVVYKKREVTAFFALPPATVFCLGESPELLTRAQWAENEYALVKTTLDGMLRACESKVLEKLPDLLNG